MSLTFIGEFLRNPAGVGAIYPSSPLLAAEIASSIGLENAKVVVEFGPGNGACTGHILRNMSADGHFLAVEQSQRMAAEWKGKYPNHRLYVESAANIERILKDEGLEHIDAIVSGLPWASFSATLQDEILEPALRALRPGGRFATFAYLQGTVLPAGRRFRAKLSHHFSRVEKSRVVWSNMPPALVYRCTK